MKSEKCTVQQQFMDRRQYRIPFYQRRYVWNRDDQWQPLWDDILEKADTRLNGTDPTPHFLGAIVLEPNPRKGLLGVETFNVIDGQQRLSTLQYILAAHLIVAKRNDIGEVVAPLEACLWNDNPNTMGDPEIEKFKVWPTFQDRSSYQSAMTSENLHQLRARFPESFTKQDHFRKIGIRHPAPLEALMYFCDATENWLTKNKNFGNVGSLLEILVRSVLLSLVFIPITLEGDDDAQVIFETLNGRGATLHATDLIRNYIFLRADRERQDSKALYENKWSPFETAYWSADQRRGRLRRPRLEWFVQTVIQSETGEEVEISNLYVGFKNFVNSSDEVRSASDQLDLLADYSDIYRQLIDGDGSDPIAWFGREVVVWEASTLHSISCWIARSGLNQDEQREIFSDLLSYTVRRAVCGLTAKNYNNVFLQMLKLLRGSENFSPSEFRRLLSMSRGGASRWPDDNEFSKSWLSGDAITNIGGAKRMKAILARLENQIRSPKTEEAFLGNLGELDVEHIMPKSWYRHWPLYGEVISDFDALRAQFQLDRNPEADKRRDGILRRERAIRTFGNLTLVSAGVNRSLQHRGFLQKRNEYFSSSNLQLNRELMLLTEWDEDAIEERGNELLKTALEIWRGPQRLEN